MEKPLNSWKGGGGIFFKMNWLKFFVFLNEAPDPPKKRNIITYDLTHLQGPSVDKSCDEREEEKGSSDGQTGHSVTTVLFTDTVVDHHLHQQHHYDNNL